MTGYNISLDKGLLPDLLVNQDGLAKLVQEVLNQVLEAQMEDSLQASRHERTDERQGYRNGYRPRTLYTRVGPITLQVPQCRDGSFSTEIFKRYQRSEQGFVLALMEMVVQGVSTRKVTKITEELCGASFSKSTVSSLCVGLDVVSDSHSGLKEAARKNFQGSSWQRCQVHLMRNLLGSCSRRYQAEVATAAKRIFGAPDMKEARRLLVEFAERFERTAPKAVECLERGFEDAMAVMALPEKYRKRLKSTNMVERLNEEVRRRERVIRIFPNDESALRLIGAVLAEKHEEWSNRRYLDMSEYIEWSRNRAESDDKNVVKMSN